jgi:hypothetical protein
MITIDKLEITNNSQQLYDAFNSFILSSDKKVFNKLIARTLLYNEVKDLPGDIVECGVFKGSGIYTFLKLKQLFNPNSLKKIIGFDFFNTDDLLNSIGDETDKETMNLLFKGRYFKHEKKYDEFLYEQILSDGFSSNDIELVQGDVSLTTKKFTQNNPGFKISLLYMDLDLEEPTYNTLNNLWENLVKGGVVVFDEYGHHNWSESKGVDRFINEKNIPIKTLNYYAPTAYIKKT